MKVKKILKKMIFLEYKRLKQFKTKQREKQNKIK